MLQFQITQHTFSTSQNLVIHNTTTIRQQHWIWARINPNMEHSLRPLLKRADSIRTFLWDQRLALILGATRRARIGQRVQHPQQRTSPPLTSRNLNTIPLSSSIQQKQRLIAMRLSRTSYQRYRQTKTCNTWHRASDLHRPITTHSSIGKASQRLLASSRSSARHTRKTLYLQGVW